METDHAQSGFERVGEIEKPNRKGTKMERNSTPECSNFRVGVPIPRKFEQGPKTFFYSRAYELSFGVDDNMLGLVQIICAIDKIISECEDFHWADFSPKSSDQLAEYLSNKIHYWSSFKTLGIIGDKKPILHHGDFVEFEVTFYWLQGTDIIEESRSRRNSFHFIACRTCRETGSQDSRISDFLLIPMPQIANFGGISTIYGYPPDFLDAPETFFAQRSCSIVVDPNYLLPDTFLSECYETAVSCYSNKSSSSLFTFSFIFGETNIQQRETEYPSDFPKRWKDRVMDWKAANARVLAIIFQPLAIPTDVLLLIASFLFSW